MKNTLKLIYAAVYGTLFYAISLPALFIGPFYAGFTAGRKAQTTPKNGFYVGIVSATAGLFLWLYFLYNILHININNISSGIFYVIFITYSLLSIPATGVGGFIAGLNNTNTYTRSKAYVKNKYNKTENRDNPPTFIICGSCGTANPEHNINCINCRNTL